MAAPQCLRGVQRILSIRPGCLSQPVQRSCFCSLSSSKASAFSTRWGRLTILQRHTRSLKDRAPARFGKRQSLVPVEKLESAAEATWRNLGKPFGFTLLVGGCSFAACSIWQYETLRTYVQQVADKVQEQFSPAHYGKAGNFRHHLNFYWNNLSPGQKLVATLISMNAGVFLLWRVASLRGTMMKYFASSPASGAPCWSMLLSTFSHYSLIHVVMNMYVLWSFTPAITGLLGREQFLAMFLSAGVFSSFTSYAYKIVIRGSRVPSLGASGAIMAVLGAVCCQYPDAQLSIAFVGAIYPHSFSADSAMKAVILFDTLGVVLRWRFFDHAAHLGGMLFGLWYMKYGHELLWKRRETFLKWWHEIRGKVQ